MAKLEQTYSVEDAKAMAGDGYPFVPAGVYTAIIRDSMWKDNKSSTGRYVQLDVLIVDGKYEGTVLIDRLNLVNPNETAVRIAIKTLGDISDALGLDTTPSDTELFHGKRLNIKVEVTAPTEKDGKQYKEQSVIKKYFAASGVPSAATSVASESPAAQGNPFAAPF